jgi:hypothetical protein
VTQDRDADAGTRERPRDAACERRLAGTGRRRAHRDDTHAGCAPALDGPLEDGGPTPFGPRPDSERGRGLARDQPHDIDVEILGQCGCRIDRQAGGRRRRLAEVFTRERDDRVARRTGDEHGPAFAGDEFAHVRPW